MIYLPPAFVFASIIPRFPEYGSHTPEYAFILRADMSRLVFALTDLAKLPQHIGAVHEYERGYENDIQCMLQHQERKDKLEDKKLTTYTGIIA